MDQLSSDRSSNLPMPDPALMDLLEQPKEKGITSWFRWSSKRERKERVSLRVKTVGYQPDLSPLLKPRASTPNRIGRDVPDNVANQSTDSLGSPFLAKFKELASMREGSVRSSVFNLCSATLGAGALSLPYAFSQAGLITSLFLLILASLSTLLSISLLIKTANHTGGKSYEEITVMLFGRGVGGLVEASIIIFCFGTCVAYIVAVGDILQEGVLDLLPSSVGLTREMLMIIFTGIVMFPLSLNSRINSLRYSSLFGICSIFFLVFVAAYHSITALLTDGWSQSWGSSEVELWAGSFRDIVSACPVIMFAFTCQVNVFSIYEELERKGERRMKRVSNGAVTVCFIAYLLMGTMGYLDFGPNTQSNILKNYCVRKNPSPLIIASFICITITIIMAFPLNIFPMRYTVEVILARQGQGQKSGSEEPLLMEEGVSADVNDDLGVSMASSKDATFTVDALETSDDSSISGNLRHFLLTGLITGSALLVALVTPNISVVFQLMGGTTSAFVCFVLPAAFALKLGFTKGTGLHAPTWGLAVGGVLVGAISTVVTLIGIAYPEETKDAVC
ncbi:hypothetical protein TrCOL_g13908 [Triparma columacea]|uniref:Amino acid transporter transmembrane domain-containing protein n=1 Tax=Triparma columacea TaxID=722753 RepID=A0A9W7GG00_9STRA|nr:hypothetical protein TrCOL_g13908 [Triparma columacea]